MEAEIIRHFLPKLVTAISDSIVRVSSACFAEGIISKTTYESVLQSGVTNEVKTNNLLLVVIGSTESDSRCFGTLLKILDEVLPYAVKGAVLSAMRKEASDQAQCMSVVSQEGNSQVASVAPLTSGEVEVMKQQTCLIRKLEDVIRQHERACVQKEQLEENMKTKEEENKKLKKELDSLKQNKTTNIAMNENLIAKTENRISACENEMSELQRRIKKLELIIEEQDMQVKRGTNEVGSGVVNTLGQFSMLARQKFEKQEADYLAILKEKEKDLIAAQEEGKEKEQRSLEILKEKDTKLQLLQKREDELHHRILELEHKSALQEVLLVAQEKGKEKEQHSLEVLKEKEAELQKQKIEDELRRCIQQLVHKNALQKKEMQIMELELQNLMSWQKEESTSEEKKPTLRTREFGSGRPSVLDMFTTFCPEEPY